MDKGQTSKLKGSPGRVSESLGKCQSDPLPSFFQEGSKTGLKNQRTFLMKPVLGNCNHVPEKSFAVVL